ncbi:monovalent cation/H+ antiporter complex subunit F [Halococcus hamelinensis]|uniref:Multiple resistance and pH regulation protein F n=1 Tax=Halococcus hamelinensis 100A6 TaxID=1132509 RepID=M0M3Q9_9EURY|nr:monovalent cation/H+ antiporter complex subunit F [Halococcus hamelinensis]EMA39264.1 multiple resistance and pH regulation protein F [Halococcus hamelinensis 100A6]
MVRVAIEAPAFLTTVIQAGLVVATLVTLVAGYRVIRGPTTPDRVVALDTIATNVVSVALLFALLTNQGFFVSVSLVLAIIGFVSTIAVARYVTEGDIIE